MRIVLIEPEIPQNVGNIGRLCVALNVGLVLVGKLGFSLDEKSIRRSGMDYWKDVQLTLIDSVESFYPLISQKSCFISTKGEKLYSDIAKDVDLLIFGNESSGLPKAIYADYPAHLYRIPMRAGVRSINLATSAGVVAYHVANLNGFFGLV